MKNILLPLAIFACACTGPVGPAGPPGMDGQDGRDGVDGEDETALSVWLTCSADLDLIGDSRKETSLSYTTIFYSNGDVEVECETRLGSAQDDFSHSYYPSVVNGAQTGYCAASSDYPPDDLVAGARRDTTNAYHS